MASDRLDHLHRDLNISHVIPLSRKLSFLFLPSAFQRRPMIKKAAKILSYKVADATREISFKVETEVRYHQMPFFLTGLHLNVTAIVNMIQTPVGRS